MLEKLMEMFKRVFSYNKIAYLAEPANAFEGLSNINTFANTNSNNIVNSTSSDVKQENIDNNEEDTYLKEIDFLSFIFDDDEDVEVLENEESENMDYLNDDEENEEVEVKSKKFVYDESKAIEMNKKIDYYKKNSDKIYTLSLEEIDEMNFYYEKRIEKLENKLSKK